jgi:hypothetical protein
MDMSSLSCLFQSWTEGDSFLNIFPFRCKHMLQHPKVIISMFVQFLFEQCDFTIHAVCSSISFWQNYVPAFFSESTVPQEMHLSVWNLFWAKYRCLYREWPMKMFFQICQVNEAAGWNFAVDCIAENNSGYFCSRVVCCHLSDQKESIYHSQCYK